MYNAEDLAVAEELARRAAAAIDNALLHRDSKDARREAEGRAQQETALREELERVTESRARLVRGFSHDVREPLGAAIGYLDLLDEGIVDPLSDKQRGMMQQVRRSIQGAVSLTEDLLELARAEAGQIEIEPGPMQLTKAALDVVDRVPGQGRSQGHGHKDRTAR